MALSMLEDVQTARGIAAALAGMKSEENCNISSQSGANTNTVYSGLHSAAAASALGMLSPQLFAANRAAAIMAAGFPVSTLASMTTLFPPHAALFPTWHQSPGSMHPHSAAQHSPPESPVSPLSASKKTNHNNNNITSSNSNLITATTELLSKKLRKPNLKRERSSPVIDIHSNSTDIFSPGPISPPSSDSSPNSNHDPSVLHTAKDPSRDKCFTCKICNRSFGYKHVLQNHERTHTGEKPFECPECHKRFTRDHHLKTHMRLHTGEKPYHCNHCDRQFVQVANLRRHLRVHTGERPYSCEMCDAKFSDSNQLKSHILIHNGEKPFNCDRCHLKFRRRHHLMHHKCGIQSPPTPAISPTMSDVAMSDQKSATSSSTFDDCGDISKSNHRNLFDMPLDLTEDGNLGGVVLDCEKRSGKTKGRPRVVRLPQQILHIPTSLPEQTEPEDLSMHSPRSRSPLSVHHEDDLEDLDDAATLYLKQQRKRLITDQITPVKVRD